MSGSFFKKVFTPLLKRISIIIDSYFGKKLLFFVSGFERRYTNRLRSYNEYFSLKETTTKLLSLSLVLDQVFINLKLYPAKASEQRKGTLFPQPMFIWDVLNNDDPTYRIVIITGKPGSGKTTLLQYVALLIAKKRAKSRSERRIPFLLQLRKYAEDIISDRDEKINLTDLLCKDLRSLRPPAGWFDDMLNNDGNRCIVLLDGLDEVSSHQDREAVLSWIEKQALNYGKTHFIITSRPHGYRKNDITGATVLEIQDFSRDQIADFVYKWHESIQLASARNRKDDEAIKAVARENANELIEKIDSSNILAQLSTTPLLLTIMTILWFSRTDVHLPSGRASLYDEICRALLRRRKLILRGVRINDEQKRAILQILALHMMKQRHGVIPISEAIDKLKSELPKINLKDEDANDFLSAMINDSGLMTENDMGQFAFSHLTYQEYLSALETRLKNDENLLLERIDDSWWHETILLYAAISNATEIARTCLNTAVVWQK